jgi:hypothetical protein
MSNFHKCITLLLFGSILIPAGCSKEELKQKMEQVQTQAKAYTETAVQAVEEKLPESGSISLNMTPPVDRINKLDVQLISIGDGRPKVVQVISYDPKGNTYPRILLQGPTEAPSATGLAGQTVPCDLYFQQAGATPIAMTKPGESINVSFGSFNGEDKVLTAKLGASQLISSDGKTIQLSGGDLVAVVRSEGN